MTSITLKGIPEVLHKSLKKQARENHRSLNQEILYWLSVHMSSRRPSNASILKNARKARRQMRGSISILGIQKAMQDGHK